MITRRLIRANITVTRFRLSERPIPLTVDTACTPLSGAIDVGRARVFPRTARRACGRTSLGGRRMALVNGPGRTQNNLLTPINNAWTSNGVSKRPSKDAEQPINTYK